MLEDDLRADLAVDLVTPVQKELLFPAEVRVRECIQPMESVLHVLHRIVELVCVNRVAEAFLGLFCSRRSIGRKATGLVDIVAEILIYVYLGLFLFEV